ncbi:CoA transferase [Litorivicinus lipolyticus]|uniref:CoA transferase n=1 Tax=Litorivicinus lipolyticus TaxID=418701 RepID=A0A5Q2QEL4_9GAMM|nr:CoA transferase [Litorivicinus lipolyticus]QGG80466.1 CoA transferase [Litorivicinus lipolyticus]
MTLPLAGVRVLDLSAVLAGPFASYQLHLLGAEVTKVESPSGDLARQLGADPRANQARMGVSFQAQNAGKHSIVLDLKSSVGVADFKALVADTDVVLENFRPGVMDRLGLGFATLSMINPRLIYCAISGFGQTGPLAKTPAYDQIIQGMSGVMAITGQPDGEPTRAGFPVADSVGGLVAAMAISAALNRREQPQMIDVSMLESLMSTMGWAVSNWLQAGVAATRLGNENMTSAPSGAFRTSDGLINVAANQDVHWQRLCDALEQPEWASDPRFVDREARKANRDHLGVLIESVLMTAPRAHWLSRLAAADVPAGPVLELPEALAQPQLQARGFVHAGAQPIATNGFLYNGQRLTPQGPAPTLGEHNE